MAADGFGVQAVGKVRANVNGGWLFGTCEQVQCIVKYKTFEENHSETQFDSKNLKSQTNATDYIHKFGKTDQWKIITLEESSCSSEVAMPTAASFYPGVFQSRWNGWKSDKTNNPDRWPREGAWPASYLGPKTPETIDDRTLNWCNFMPALSLSFFFSSFALIPS